jgi:DNA-binding response OmpR family regulator
MSKENPTIMVVEDEVLLLQAITKKLKLSEMDVLSCSSGGQAVDYLNSIDELPDAIWLDYYLKDMNGLAFMQELKSNPKWTDIPVLVVSNSASPEKVHNMLGLEARKYILKAEYRLDEIIAMIRDFIASNEPGAPNTAQESYPNPTPFLPPTEPAQEKVDEETPTAPAQPSV